MGHFVILNPLPGGREWFPPGILSSRGEHIVLLSMNYFLEFSDRVPSVYAQTIPNPSQPSLMASFSMWCISSYES